MLLYVSKTGRKLCTIKETDLTFLTIYFRKTEIHILLRNYKIIQTHVQSPHVLNGGSH